MQSEIKEERERDRLNEEMARERETECREDERE